MTYVNLGGAPRTNQEIFGDVGHHVAINYTRQRLSANQQLALADHLHWFDPPQILAAPIPLDKRPESLAAQRKVRRWFNRGQQALEGLPPLDVLVLIMPQDFLRHDGYLPTDPDWWPFHVATRVYGVRIGTILRLAARR